MSVTFDCTEACEAEAICTVCHKRKAPRGRSVPTEMGAMLCDHDCEGYWQEPQAPVLAERIEQHACAVTWSRRAGVQQNLELIG